MVKSKFNAPQPRHKFTNPEGQSQGILDDYAERKNISTKEGTIEQIPTNDNHITNKKFVLDQFPVTHASTTGKTTDDHHAEVHTIVSHDTTATGTELDTLTDDSMANTLHRHSELSAGDGDPNPVLDINDAGRVGVGVTGSDILGKLHIRLTASGGGVPGTDGDSFVLERNGGLGITFLTTPSTINSRTVSIWFGDENPVSGLLRYDHRDDTFRFRTGGGAINFVLNSAGGLSLGSGSVATETLQVTGVTQLGDGGSTNYVNIDATGKQVFVGSAGMCYGTLSVVANANETTITTQNVFVQFTDFNTNGVSKNTSPDHTNDHILITKAGDYDIKCCITANSIAGAGATFEYEIQKNNGASRIGAAHGDRTLSGGGSESGSITICTMARLEVNDTVELWVKNEDNTQNIITEDASLSALQVGG